MLSLVKKFLQTHSLEKKPVLLAFSGGTDSMLLLHLLLECKEEFELDIHLAHVDHGWREQSTYEAKGLANLAESKGLIFHLKKLENKEDKNLEEKARIQRMAFFKELYQKYDYQAVIFAHHGQDLAETVLKRVFEGAHLPFMGGMDFVSVYENMLIWRPLLEVSKKQITNANEKLSLNPIIDATNFDTKFLRAKMRQKILPSLADLFGKEIQQNLITLSQRANELHAYFDKKIEKALENVKVGTLGVFIDFEKHPLEKLEKTFLIQKLAKKQNITLPRSSLDLIVSSIEEKKTVQVPCVNGEIRVEKSLLFLLHPLFFQRQAHIKLALGKSRIGPFDVQVTEGDKETVSSNWLDLFLGKATLIIPKGEYVMNYPSHGDIFRGKSLKSFFYKHKVPSFLRFSMPVICNSLEVVGEFLSGQKKEIEGSSFWKVQLQLTDIVN